MKITRIEVIDQFKNDVLNVACDVSKAKLDYYSMNEHDDVQERWTGIVANADGAIRKELTELHEQSIRKGYRTLKIICEATGIYHRRLLRIARKMGFYTALVSAEAVHKSQVLESNDYSKTDSKDARTIFLVSQNGKQLQDRDLQKRWLLLRELNLNYERIEKEMTQIKNRLHQALFELFCDLSFKNDWIFKGKASEQIAELYGLNPYRMVAEGRSGFVGKLKRRKVRMQTINRVWRDAQQSSLFEQDGMLTEWLETEVRELFITLKQLQDRQLKLRYRMTGELDALHKLGELSIDPHAGPIGPFMLARILSETGSLRDFKHHRALWKYAGVNICEKESGKMKGQDKISKKGRSRLRCCAQQASLNLVVKNGLFGSYYHHKRQQGMAGNKAMLAVARKLLKLLYGLEKSGMPYNPQRVFESESQQFSKAA
ncbi:MAG: transposase [Opitutales bacterium]|nr:transposase [Opitutales bacterium]